MPAAWQKAELPITVRSITPAAEMVLRLAHDPAYVRGVLEGKVSNGFGNTSLGDRSFLAIHERGNDCRFAGSARDWMRLRIGERLSSRS
jgi:hypothetical protein